MVNNMFKKLKIKFIATIMILLTSIVLIIFGVIFYTTKINNENALFSQMLASSGAFNERKESNTNELHNIEGILVMISFSDYSMKYKSSYDLDESEITELVDKLLEKNKRLGDRDKGFIEDDGVNYAYLIQGNRQGIQIIFRDSSWYTHAMRRLIINFVVIGVVSLSLLFIVSVFIARTAIKPVEAAYIAQKQFIADASHELKTPLAIIKTNLDVINSNEYDTIKNQRKWFDYIGFQTDRMNKLVNNLLYLAKSDNKEVMGVVSEFNLSDAIMNQILSFEAVIYENNLRLDCNIDENIVFKGDKESINQLIGIFIDNAIKHAFENTIIVVGLSMKKQRICLTVENNGDTIKPEDLDKIFERFYRVDKARSRQKGSYGLGLSIAKSIVEKHGGRIKAESENNITKFVAEFPI